MGLVTIGSIRKKSKVIGMKSVNSCKIEAEDGAQYVHDRSYQRSYCVLPNNHFFHQSRAEVLRGNKREDDLRYERSGSYTGRTKIHLRALRVQSRRQC